MRRLSIALYLIPLAASAVQLVPDQMQPIVDVRALDANGQLRLSPNGARLAPLELARDVLQQCDSRAAPLATLQIWQVTATQIADLEARLVPYIARRASIGLPVPPSTFVYGRQYVGFVRNGAKYIYGDFFPAEGQRPSEPQRKSTTDCNGGKAFWGIVYRVDTASFEEPGFNDSE